MLRERVISSVIGIPIILLFLFLGKYFFAFLVGVITVACVDELYSMLVMREYKPNVLAGAAASIGVVFGALFGGSTGILFVLVISTIIVMILQFYKQERIIDSGLTLLALLYIAAMLSHLVLIYDLNYGVIGALLIFIGTWASDIAAYSIGTKFGKRKIAPRISANKSLEGLVSGIAAPLIIIGILFMLPWLPFASQNGYLIAFLKGAGMGFVLGIAAPIGDLVESRIKREMMVKDSGAIIPGHGGFLDRFDSVIFTSVFGYYAWLILFS